MRVHAAALAALSLILTVACGSDDSSSDAPDDTVSTSPTDSSTADAPETVDLGPGARYLQLGDSEAGPDCSTGTSPGADIDAGYLYASPAALQTPIATLSGCRWLDKGSACDNNGFAVPKTVDGEKDATAVTGFVSLNGGTILCEWSEGTEMRAGMVVKVIEVTGAGSDAERFRVRGCSDDAASDCGSWQTSKTSTQNFPAGSLF